MLITVFNLMYKMNTKITTESRKTRHNNQNRLLINKKELPPQTALSASGPRPWCWARRATTPLT